MSTCHDEARKESKSSSEEMKVLEESVVSLSRGLGSKYYLKSSGGAVWARSPR